MNPQFVQQQQLYSVPTSASSGNRVSPGLQPSQHFQNIPLGSPKPIMSLQDDRPASGSHYPPNVEMPPSNLTQPPLNPGHFPSRSQIPTNQLPPSHSNVSHEHAKSSQINPLGPPPSVKPEISANILQNGPPQFSVNNQFQNGQPHQHLQNGRQQGPPMPSMPSNPMNKPPGSAASPFPPTSKDQSQLPHKQSQFSPNFLPAQQSQMNPSISDQNSFHPQPSMQPPPLANQSTMPPSQSAQQVPVPNKMSLTSPQASQQSAMMGQQPVAEQSSLGPPMMQSPPQMPGQPPLPNQQLPGQPPLSQAPFLGQQSSGPPMHRQHPPFPGQPPLMSGSMPPMPGHQQRPIPGQMNVQPPQFNQGPPPLGGGQMPPMPGQFNKPPQGMPLANQYPGPNQLTSQMQGMNINSSHPYGGAPMGMKNGPDNGPHMPPQLNQQQQQQYMNGQQMRGYPPQPGYPPMPGQAPMGVPGAYPQSQYQQPQQAKRLDPDQMPSPIQVIEDDQRNRSGVFCTDVKGCVPPLVTTHFVVKDQGSTSPRFMRSTMYNVPISHDMMKQTAVPFSLVISPMARVVEGEYPPPIVNFGELGPIRCIRCKAYMCPFMQFIDSGRRFQCLFCKATTDVPTEYFQHLDHTGQRMDRFERPELILGTYEMIATTDYCRNNIYPKQPALIFVIDVSYNNVKSGLVNLLCSQMKEIIKHLPIDQGYEKSNMKVGFITYNSSVHFYNIKGNLAAPQMLIVGDTQEMFMPLLDGFLCTPEESDQVIDALMQQIPSMFGETRETETILLPAILAGLEALKASECSGKLLVFHSTLPTADAPGRLKNRDDRKLLGTEKERTVLTPQTQAYNQLGQDCVGAGCSVDLFIFNNAYIDIATISQVSRLSGGEVFKYTYFQADIDGERLIQDIIMDISRPIAFDAIMRVRTSTGIRPTDFYGHFFMSNTTDIELAAIDADKAVAVEIKHDDKLSEEENVYIQAALLYTSCSGQRRLRIMNLSLKTCSQMADLYRSCDSDTIINYMSKQAIYKLLDNNPKAVKDSIISRTAQILATYRKNCASPSSAGQLILPECMKLLPLYVNCLLKSDAVSGGSDMTIDDRSFVMQVAMTMDIPTSVNYFYPRLIPLHELDPSIEPVEVPSPIRCTIEKMSEQGVYLLENGIHLFIWIGLGANSEFVQNIFGVPSAIQVDIEKSKLPELDNVFSIAVRTMIDEIRIQRHRCMRLTLVRQREKMEPVLKHFLAEDRDNDGSPSYVDFLVHMHKEIRTLLS